MSPAVYELLIEFARWECLDYFAAANESIRKALSLVERNISIGEHYGEASERYQKSERAVWGALFSALKGAWPEADNGTQAFAAQRAIIPLLEFSDRFVQRHTDGVAPLSDWKKFRGALLNAIDEIGPIVDSSTMRRASRVGRKTNSLDGGRRYDLNLRWLLWMSSKGGISLPELAEAMVKAKLAPDRQGVRSHSRKVSAEIERLRQASVRYQLSVATKPTAPT